MRKTEGPNMTLIIVLFWNLQMVELLRETLRERCQKHCLKFSLSEEDNFLLYLGFGKFYIVSGVVRIKYVLSGIISIMERRCNLG